MVTGCASCTLMLKDYPTLFAGEPEQAAAQVLAKRVTHISEFVSQSPVKPAMASQQSTKCTVAYHSSCHLRAAGVTKRASGDSARLAGRRVCGDA